MSCSLVYRDYISCGVETIVIDAGEESTNYNVIIENKGATYKKAAPSVYGLITLQVSDFPDGLFNPYAGPFTLSIDNGCDPFLFCDTYRYIEFEVVNGTEEKNTLTCCEIVES